MQKLKITLPAALILLALLMGSQMAHCQPQGWQWAKAVQSANLTTVESTALDQSGNVYFTGFCDSAAYIGPFLVRSGTAYLAKLDPTGQWEWAVSVGRNNLSVVPAALSIDRAGNPVIVGRFTGATQFGSTTLRGGSFSVFVAKISPAGQWLWAVSAGDTDQFDDATAVAVAPNGRIWLAGAFTDTISFGATQLISTTINSRREGFVAMLSDSGQWQQAWSTRSQGPFGSVRAVSITAGAAGDTYVAGQFSGDVRFGSTTLSRPSGASATGFVAKLTVGGSWQWARQWGALGTSVGNGVVVDPVSHDPVVAGTYAGRRITLDTITLVPAPNRSGGGLIGRLDAMTGQWRWAQQTSPRGQSGPNLTSLSVDSAGVLYVCGNGLVFPLQLGTIVIPSPKVFVALADAATGQWQQVWAGTGGSAIAQHVAASAPGQAVLAGAVTDQPTTFAVFPIASPGGYASAYVARLTAAPLDIPNNASPAAFALWPNPAGAGEAHLTLAAPARAAWAVEVRDALGRVVRRAAVAVGQTDAVLDVRGLASGVYSVRAGANHRRLLVE